MLITAGKFQKDFIEDLDETVELIEKYKKLDETISNSLHYRMLVGKTQMIGRQKGTEQKTGRSRLEHTERIVQIAKKIVNKVYDSILEKNPEINDSKELQTIFYLNKELDTAKAICMVKSHDIGHIAFAHAGEEAMNNFSNKIEDSKEIEEILREHRAVFGAEYEIAQGHQIPTGDSKKFEAGFLSFEHNELSALLLNKIIRESDIEFSESEIKDLIIGVLAHSTSRVKSFSLIKDNFPAQIVRIADKIEYINADYEELKDFVKVDKELLEEMYENDDNMDEETIDKILQYSQYSLPIRIDLATTEIADEAINKGRIWESRTKGSTLRKFRKCYEDAIFLYDSVSSYRLLKDELLPRLDKPEELKKFYEENPGVQVYYPEDKLRFIKSKTESFKIDENTSEMDDPLWLYAVPFKSVMLGENSERIFSIYSKVLEYYYQHPQEIPFRTEVYSTPLEANNSSDPLHFRYELNANYTEKMQRLFEYISLLDDQAMMDKYYELVEERIKYGENYGIEPVRVCDLKNSIVGNYTKSVNKFKGTHTLQEAVLPYIKKGKEFFYKRLTEKGRKIYEQNYRRKFSEYAIDERNFRRMIEADISRGNQVRTMEDFYNGDDVVIKVMKANSEKAGASLRQSEPEDSFEFMQEKELIDEILPNDEPQEGASKTPRPTDGVAFTGKTRTVKEVKKLPTPTVRMRSSAQPRRPAEPETKGFKRLMGVFGLAMELLKNKGEVAAFEEYLRRKEQNGSEGKNSEDEDPHGDGQK